MNAQIEGSAWACLFFALLSLVVGVATGNLGLAGLGIVLSLLAFGFLRWERGRKGT